VLLLALAGATVPARAQGHDAVSQIEPNALRNEVERRVGEKLVCMCGSPGCGKEIVGTCACSYAAQMRGEIRALFDEGKTEEEVLQHYVTLHGSLEPLSSPPSEGFNRLAWLFPYLMGATGAVLVGTAAVKWSRRPRPTSTDDTAASEDPDIEERLDDELRNLD
jgi:cytochrome c-type biogenesis protein CcmH/NrfF